MTNKDRIIDISKRLGLSHVGSNLSCLPVLEELYEKKKPEDIVILDNAHAHLAHLLFYKHNGLGLSNKGIEDMIHRYGIHCDKRAGCDSSGGSLGHGLGIGIGYALADRKRDVYVIVSDGSMMEGSGWEALRIAGDLKLSNFHIHCNFNSYTAVAKIDPKNLYQRMIMFYDDITLHLTDNGLPELEGVKGHYETL